MHTVDKHMSLLRELSVKTTVLQLCERIQIEQKRPPHFRTYVAIGRDMEVDDVREVEDLAESLTLTANVFRVGNRVNAITFVDVDEQAGQQHT